MRVHIHGELYLVHQSVHHEGPCAVDTDRTPANVHRHTTNEQLAAPVARQHTWSIPRTGPDDPAHSTMLNLDPGGQAFVRRAEGTQEVR